MAAVCSDSEFHNTEYSRSGSVMGRVLAIYLCACQPACQHAHLVHIHGAQSPKAATPQYQRNAQHMLVLPASFTTMLKVLANDKIRLSIAAAGQFRTQSGLKRVSVTAGRISCTSK